MLKKILLLLLLTTVLKQYCFSQKTDTLHFYVDYYEKPIQREHAIYHIKVYKEKPADADWKRELYGYMDNNLLSTGRSKDSLGEIKHGDYQFFYIVGGSKSENGRYQNGKREGEWTQVFPKGKIQGSYHYHAGKMAGTNMSWYENGNILDSFALDNNGNGMGYGFYESGQKKYEGKFAAGLKTGTWTYYYDVARYHRSMEAVFDADSLLSSKCLDLNGELQNICFYEKEANFIGGEKAWVRYLVQELTASSYPNYMKKMKTYEVIVSFVVAKDGTIADVKVENPDVKKLDKIAESIIRNSPPWDPAVQYNQKVNAYRRQPLSFVVD